MLRLFLRFVCLGLCFCLLLFVLGMSSVWVVG